MCDGEVWAEGWCYSSLFPGGGLVVLLEQVQLNFSFRTSHNSSVWTSSRQ